MFCPNCGKSDQKETTYCRQCGTFLPDFDKLKTREISPEEHLKVNSVLNLMTAVVSITLAILLYSFFLGGENTHPVIYITAGFLTAMFFWQAQVFWRTRQLKKHFPNSKNLKDDARIKNEIESAKTKELLNDADVRDGVPSSVTEKTTKNLMQKFGKLS